MPRPDDIPGSPDDWLRYAESDLALARMSRPEGVLWEHFCFHAEQAAEKAIKGVLLSLGVGFRYVHDLDEHLRAVAAAGIAVPESVQRAVELNDYAFFTRYPFNAEAVSEAEYRDAVGIAEAVVKWSASIIRSRARQTGTGWAEP